MSDILPDLDKYKGPPLEFGRMEATASKPDVEQQFGMIAGIPGPVRSTLCPPSIFAASVP